MNSRQLGPIRYAWNVVTSGHSLVKQRSVVVRGRRRHCYCAAMACLAICRKVGYAWSRDRSVRVVVSLVVTCETMFYALHVYWSVVSLGLICFSRWWPAYVTGLYGCEGERECVLLFAGQWWSFRSHLAWIDSLIH